LSLPKHGLLLEATREVRSLAKLRANGSQRV
jgi:hypothetical protein